MPGADCPFRDVKNTGHLLRRIEGKKTPFVGECGDDLGYGLPDDFF